MGKIKTLEESLLAYRINHQPLEFSIKQNLINEVFSSDSYMELGDDEKRQFESRLDECRVTFFEKIYQTDGGKQVNLGDILHTIVNPVYKDLIKKERPVIYTSYDGTRPTGNKAYNIWSGFQIIDMDIKDVAIANKLKNLLFNKLKAFHWFFGVVLSSSKNGLHIYTKIQVPIDLPADKMKLLYLANYRHKYSFIYLACLDIIDELGATKDELIKWMDMAMFKPQQGAFITYDANPLINTHFFQDFIYVNIDGVEDLGHPNLNWVTFPDLKEIFRKWEWFEEDDHKDDPNYSGPSINVVNSDMELAHITNRYHYKHFERWRLANTLVKIYGKELGYKYLRAICSVEVLDKELHSDCETAARHEKELDTWAVRRLNSYHGFKIKIAVNDQETDLDALNSKLDLITDPTCLQPAPKTLKYHLTSSQYLSDIKDDILSNISEINLIEAGAGVGKTEMVKSIINDNKKIILVMPFQSTIKAKIVKEKDWCFSFGNIKPDLNAKCIAMTVDKFSRLSLIEMQSKGFEYIFIDESHLLFQSEYRDVMPKVIAQARDSQIPIIMMSGTPIGETVFFENLTHIKVIKDDIREKTFTVRVCDSEEDSSLHIARNIAEDIHKGIKCLFPTNRGSKYEEQIRTKVKYFLENKFADKREPKIEYYKKSNTGDPFMAEIDFQKTMADVDLLMCSNFLSVGVDICDKGEFRVYLNDYWMPQEIEQFANRLRGNDLHIRMYVSKYANDGTPKNIYEVKPINLTLNDDEIKDIHSILRIVNGSIERNPIEYKFNPLISSFISQHKFIEYDDLENKYYLNDIAFKTVYFERKYREYVEQLPVIVRGMMSYGYKYKCENMPKVTDVDIDELKAILQESMTDYKNAKQDDVEELLALITEERLSIYKDVSGGKYEIVKADRYRDDLENFKMYVKNIEVFEQTVPLVISMSKMYDIPTIKAIFEHCRKKDNTYNFAAVRRIKALTNLIYNSKQNRLDIPIKELMNDVDDFVTTNNGKCSKTQVIDFINSHALKYAQMESTEKVIIDHSVLTMQKLTDTLENMFKCMVNVGKPDKDKNVSLSKTEILWKERIEFTRQNDNPNSRIFVLDEIFEALD